eukprot:scaffold6975_cov83-Skeletonema_menzelii.AAC.18
MIKNKKNLLFFRSGSSFRRSRKKSDKNICSGGGNNEVVTNERSQSERITSQPITKSSAVVPQTTKTPLSIISKKSRSYSPSDFYFHTTAQGGVNAPLTPLSEHYATNETLLSLFSTLYEKDQFSVAYAAGVKFVEVALLQIPQNGYFKSKKYRKQRAKSAADALRVTKLLGGMVDEIEDDVEKNNHDGNGSSCSSGIERIEKLQKLATLAQRSFDEALDEQLNDSGGDNDGVGTTSPHFQDWDVAQQLSLFWKEWGKNGSCENMLTMPDNCCTLFGGETDTVVQDEVENSNNTTKKAELFQRRQNSAPTMSERRSLHDDFGREESQQQRSEEQVDVSAKHSQRRSHDGAKKDSSIISAEKVSYTSNDDPREERLIETRDEVKSELREDQVEDSRSDDLDEELKVALSKSLAESIVGSTISTSEIHGTKGDQRDTNLPVSVVAKQYREKYESLRENGSIHVRFLDTYQGRIAESTNGCTVVAPLMCINYFTSEGTDGMNGIADDLINHVIDVHTVSVLPEVRSKLGLPEDSFIVPSDVHDYLIDTGLLSTSQFVGVCGGSILDDDHIDQFKSTLLLLNDERERKRLRGKRLGATFFFAGHVIAFHLINHEGCDHIELIDSLPNHETWKIRPSSSEVSDYEDRDPSETSSRCSDKYYEDTWERSERFDYEENRNAVRVRCLDVRHMDTLIRHYALSKFSDEEKRFCDEHVWQEANSSFDPRVFQAFIWAEK